MIGYIEGVVLEVFEKEKEGKQVKVARLFQRGEKGTIDIVLNGNEVSEGELVKFKVRFIPYLSRGVPQIALKLEDEY